jgi:hypothetical protein
LQSINSDVITSWNSQERSVATVNTKDAVFINVFQKLSYNISLPKSKSSFLFSKITSTNAEPLLTNSDGTYFLIKYFLGKGIFYLSSVPLNKDFTDLPLNALFAPLMYNMAITRAYSNANAYVIGNFNMAIVDVDLKSNEAVLKLNGKGNEFIPSQRKSGGSVNVYLDQQIEDAGFYSLQGENDKQLSVFAMNYNREESDLAFFTNDELMDLATPLNITVIKNSDRDLGLIMAGQKLGLPLWKVSIIFALIFIALEIALLKLWK